MSTDTLIYKCRACGGEMLGGEVPNGVIALYQMQNKPLPSGDDEVYDIPDTLIHDCSGKRCGIAAVVGVQFNNPRANPCPPSPA